MAYVKKIGERGRRYWVRDSKCIGCRCFSPGIYQHRGATGSGSKDSGVSLRCLENAYRGCPIDTGFGKEIATKNKAMGWRNV